jgi:exo-1,4-beta-D-glucosaminidase
MEKIQVILLMAGFLFAGVVASTASAREVVLLREDWHIQSSAEVKDKGEVISTVGFSARGWYPTCVPATVLAALVENKAYPDPYYGENLKSIPGYVEGRWLVMPEDSPFYPSWWYRTEFRLPADYKGKNIFLHLDGINYRANIWLNGRKIADSEKVTGMFRRFEFNISEYARAGEDNCLAVEMIAPGKLPEKKYRTKQIEATTGWDDHNPQPPDMNMGIWQDVYISATGPVKIRHPYVVTDLDLLRLDAAHLTVSAYVTNMTDKEITGEMTGRIERIKFSQSVKLLPGEKMLVKFSPDKFSQLNISNPRIWWPNPVGAQELYDLELAFTLDGRVSDTERVRFGIREVTTYLNDEGWRVYVVNGETILIRGGAWMTSDMLLRLSRRRYDALVRYAKEANLNMLRSEGFSIRETEEFYNLCDEYGVMVTQQIFGRSIPDEDLAVSCIEDMLLRIRNHPSLVHFLGHDETHPTESLDKAYRDLIAKYTPERTYQPHSGAFRVKNRFETGGTRTGTLELWQYAGPAHYYTHKNDGAWGFAQSGGIGGVVAPLESVRRMIPEKDLWPLWTDAWSFHTVIQGGPYYISLLKALDARYGKPFGIEEFCMSAHVLNYECARGMYEAYGRNKYSATGITTWKYDAAWPAAMTWQYIDWYLLATGAYYGAKKACEALHVQYSYDDHSICVVNAYYREFKGLEVTARVFNMDMTEMYSRTAKVDVGPDRVARAFTIDWPRDLTRSHFLKLELKDSSGKKVSDNFYWLSTRADKPTKKLYGLVPLKPTSYADHTGLRDLPQVKLDVSCRMESARDEKIAHVTLKNPADHLAFFIMLAVTKGKGGLEVAPTFWSENMFSVLPGEEKNVKAAFYAEDLEGKEPVIRVGGWNIEQGECIPR